MSKRKNITRRVIYIIMELFFISIMIFSGIKIYTWWKENNSNKKMLKEISNNVQVTIDNEDGKEEYKVDFNKLKQINPDTVAWLKVAGTDIEFPVVKTSDNEYYLKHSYDKSYNSAGWPFMDYRNKLNNTDKNIIIYGHNRRDYSMFGTLKNILNKEWYDNENNRYVTFNTENENSIYEVFSVYRIEVEDYYLKTTFTDEEFEEYIQTIKTRSIKNFGVEVTTEDKILTLSTCADNNNYRIVLHAKKI